MQGGRLLTEKVPGSIMRGGGLGDLIVSLRFHRVHQVGKLNRILNEEDWRIVSHNVIVALVSVTAQVS